MLHEPLDTQYFQRTLLSAVLDAAREHGGSHVIAADMSKAEMNYRQLILRSLILRSALAPSLEGQNFVAMLLPNALGAVVTFMSLHMLGKVPCMLNFSAGETNIQHACKIAAVKTVLTSRMFVEKAKLEPVVQALQKNHTVLYLEDLRSVIGWPQKLKGLVQSLTPHAMLHKVLVSVKPDDPAVVLYTSGSEGRPKGVALSHTNILSNVHQIMLRVELFNTDVVFNALPIFHSFGLAIGMVMPLLRGIKTFLYPSPLQYREIPKFIRYSAATILLGTDTFLRGWASYAQADDFKTVRLAVAGAEKLKDSTRQQWLDSFHVDILQGYGVTEASPVVGVNTPKHHKPGTVGRVFPGIECKLVPVEGLAQGGRLHIKGPNIMLGYLNPDKPGTLLPQDPWYDTGDIVTIDDEGFLTIAGRAKRFAKIGGEMVSLLVVEEIASAARPEGVHAAVVTRDERKGEQIVLFTEDSGLTKSDMMQQARQKGLPELYLPKQIMVIASIPKLGNGKVDYPALEKQLPTL
jgi:acyl-[acyl-carrier-protein]-phospholipid O-acyltransferase/long-chain-fatty-acid--[acyl-carrier-protein] ligase